MHMFIKGTLDRKNKQLKMAWNGKVFETSKEKSTWLWLVGTEQNRVAGDEVIEQLAKITLTL